MNRLLRSAVVLLPIVLWMMLVGAPAQAAVASNFSLATVLGGTPAGQAKASGTITFNSASNVVISGTIRDICPADGAGAYLVVSGKTSASINNAILATFAWDTNGCGNGSVSYSYKVPNDGYKIQWVELTLQERDANAPCSNSGCEDSTSIRYNPYA